MYRFSLHLIAHSSKFCQALLYLFLIEGRSTMYDL